MSQNMFKYNQLVAYFGFDGGDEESQTIEQNTYFNFDVNGDQMKTKSRNDPNHRI